MDNPFDKIKKIHDEIRKRAEDEADKYLGDVEQAFPMREAVVTNPKAITDAIYALSNSREQGVRDARIGQKEMIDALITNTLAAAAPQVFAAFTGDQINSGLVDYATQIPKARVEGNQAVRQAERQAEEARLTGAIEIAKTNEAAATANAKAAQEANIANAKTKLDLMKFRQDYVDGLYNQYMDALKEGRAEDAALLNQEMHDARLKLVQAQTRKEDALTNKYNTPEASGNEQAYSPGKLDQLSTLLDGYDQIVQTYDKLSFDEKGNMKDGSPITKAGYTEATANRDMAKSQLSNMMQQASTEDMQQIMGSLDAHASNKSFVDILNKEMIRRGYSDYIVPTTVEAINGEPTVVATKLGEALDRFGDATKKFEEAKTSQDKVINERAMKDNARQALIYGRMMVARNIISLEDLMKEANPYKLGEQIGQDRNQINAMFGIIEEDGTNQ